MFCYHRVGMCLELALLSEMILLVKDNKGKTLPDDISELQLELTRKQGCKFCIFMQSLVWRM